MDVVVVGGGAAGCVLARRLSEFGARSVTLLEAGPDLRPSVPDAASACVMFQLASTCCPGRFCNTPPIWICCHGSVYEPVVLTCVSQLVSKSQ